MPEPQMTQIVIAGAAEDAESSHHGTALMQDQLEDGGTYANSPGDHYGIHYAGDGKACVRM